jgi:hypothetical protein
MASPRSKFTFAISKGNRCVRKCLANYQWYQYLYDKMKQSSLLLSHTAVAESFSPTLPPLLKYVTEKLSEKNTARRNREGITIEICRDARGIQSHRGNSK